MLESGSRLRRGLQQHRSSTEEDTMIGTLLLIILVIALLGALPTYPYSRGWGYAPSGIVGLVLVIVLIMVLLGMF
jgi:hypothetical protein